MGKVIIATDSSAYLPQEYADRYNIPVIPMTLNWDGQSYRDGIDIKATEFYTRLSKSQTLPTTSQITVQQFLDFFTPMLEAGDKVLYSGISLGLSASYNSAVIAKEQLGNPENIEIIESKLVASALSFLVLSLARASEDGASMKELLELFDYWDGKSMEDLAAEMLPPEIESRVPSPLSRYVCGPRALSTVSAIVPLSAAIGSSSPVRRYT